MAEYFLNSKYQESLKLLNFMQKLDVSYSIEILLLVIHVEPTLVRRTASKIIGVLSLV